MAEVNETPQVGETSGSKLTQKPSYSDRSNENNLMQNRFLASTTNLDVEVSFATITSHDIPQIITAITSLSACVSWVTISNCNI